MKGADGAWRQPTACNPAGEQVRVWLGPDVSRRQIKCEAALRRVLRAFRAIAPLTVTSTWRPLARVVMGEPGEDPRYEWNSVALASLGVPRAAVQAELERGIGSVATRWRGARGLGVGTLWASGCAGGLVERQIVAGLFAASAGGKGRVVEQDGG